MAHFGFSPHFLEASSSRLVPKVSEVRETIFDSYQNVKPEKKPQTEDGLALWKSVRSKVYSKFGLWDLLLDKASYDTPVLDPNLKLQAVLREMEAILEEFHKLMDACLQEGQDEIGLHFSPSLQKAFHVGWKRTKLSNEVPTAYKPIFFDNTLDVDDYGSPGSPMMSPVSEVCDFCGHQRLPGHQCSSPQPSVHCKYHIENGLIICDFLNCKNATVMDNPVGLWKHFQVLF